MITVHGRTRCQFYKGRADWAAIAPVVDAVSVPVIANGDIVDAPSAKAALEASGAAGVMIGRGIQGAPWRIAEIAHALGQGPAPDIPTDASFIDLVREHYDETLSFYGDNLGGRVIRKHLGWYMDRAGTPTVLRKRILTSPPEDVRRCLPDALETTPGRAAA